jgi:hypothetical protein
VPELARLLVEPEQADYEDDTVVLLAESKLDGTPLGSSRIRTNAFRPLAVEESVMLPEWLQGRRMIEVGRLAVDNGRIGTVVKTALLKACVMYCQQHAIEWALACGRSPIDRQYEQLTFVDVFEPGTYVPLSYAGNMPHRVMAFDITTIEERWSAARHPLLNFFCRTHHPDINIGIKEQAGPSRPPVAPHVANQPAAQITQLELA